MSTDPRILVTSAAGKTGLPVVLQLRHMGFAVRAFVRQEDHRSARLKAAGAEVFVGDQYALTDMRAAMQGMTRAYQCAPTAPNGLHFNAVFTAAAYEARLEHVVTLGQWLSAADHPSLFTRETYLGDILIRMPGDMTVTSVIPGWFADNYLMVLEMAAHLGLFPMPLGAGDVRKNAPPSNEDIARVAAVALADPGTHAGKTYRPTGPALMSPNEIATVMGQALGRRVTYRNISEKMMLKALRAMPPSNFSEAAASQLALYAEEYRRGTFAINAPTDHVRRVGGQDAEPFAAVVTRRVAAQPDLRRSLPRRLRAMAGFARMLLTPALEPQQIERQRDYVRLAAPAFSQDDAEWRRVHEPPALADKGRLA